MVPEDEMGRVSLQNERPVSIVYDLKWHQCCVVVIWTPTCSFSLVLYISTLYVKGSILHITYQWFLYFRSRNIHQTWSRRHLRDLPSQSWVYCVCVYQHDVQTHTCKLEHPHLYTQARERRKSKNKRWADWGKGQRSQINLFVFAGSDHCAHQGDTWALLGGCLLVQGWWD